MGMIEIVYAAAANAGLLKECTWQPGDGSPLQTHMVGFAAPDEAVLGGLATSTEYAISYPASFFFGLAEDEMVRIEGSEYRVRNLRATADGTEIHAKLSRL